MTSLQTLLMSSTSRPFEMEPRGFTDMRKGRLDRANEPARIGRGLPDDGKRRRNGSDVVFADNADMINPQSALRRIWPRTRRQEKRPDYPRVSEQLGFEDQLVLELFRTRAVALARVDHLQYPETQGRRCY